MATTRVPRVTTRVPRRIPTMWLWYAAGLIVIGLAMLWLSGGFPGWSQADDFGALAPVELDSPYSGFPNDEAWG